MKTPQNAEKSSHKAIWYLAMTCLVYSGIMVVLSIHFSYFVFFRERLPPPFHESMSAMTIQNGTTVSRLSSSPGFRMTLAAPLIGNFLGAILMLITGITLLNIVRERERKETHRSAVDSMILPSEKIVIKELEEAGGELTQTELARRTGLSRVQAHRVVKRLEALGVVSKHDYGMTNKVKLEKRLSGE